MFIYILSAAYPRAATEPARLLCRRALNAPLRLCCGICIYIHALFLFISLPHRQRPSRRASLRLRRVYISCSYTYVFCVLRNFFRIHSLLFVFVYLFVHLFSSFLSVIYVSFIFIYSLYLWASPLMWSRDDPHREREVYRPNLDLYICSGLPTVCICFLHVVNHTVFKYRSDSHRSGYIYIFPTGTY